MAWGASKKSITRIETPTEYETFQEKEAKEIMERTMPGPFKFGNHSTREYQTLTPVLCAVLREAIKYYDFSIVQGRRTIEEQIANLKKGVSKTLDSKHIPRNLSTTYDSSGDLIPKNTAGEYYAEGLSHAVDIVPYQRGINPWPQQSDSKKVRATKKSRFYFMQGIMYGIARKFNIPIRFGLDWDSDLDFFDQSFNDLGHLESIPENFPILVIPEQDQDDVFSLEVPVILNQTTGDSIKEKERIGY